MCAIAAPRPSDTGAHTSPRRGRRDRAWQPHPVLLHIAASLLAGMAVTASINPIDVVTTRLWNQPVVNGRGMFYSGALDCAVKTLAAEGPLGLYKVGMWTRGWLVKQNSRTNA